MVVVKTFQNGTVLNDQGRCNTDNTQRWPNFVLGKHTQPPKHSHATVRMRISTSDPRRLLSRSKASTHTLLQSHCCGEPGGSWQHVWYTHTQEARAHRRLAHSMQGCCTTRQGNQHTSIIPWQLPTASVQHWSRAFFQHPLTLNLLALTLSRMCTRTRTRSRSALDSQKPCTQCEPLALSVVVPRLSNSTSPALQAEMAAAPAPSLAALTTLRYHCNRVGTGVPKPQHVVTQTLHRVNITPDTPPC